MECCRAIAATPGRVLRPWPKNGRLLGALRQRVRERPAPPAARTVRLTALPQGRAAVPTVVLAEGIWGLPLRTPIGMGGFLVEHPRARFLVDPALCADVHRRVLPELPQPLRSLVAPEKPVRGLGEALREQGVDAADIDFALPTHLHWDHVSGLLDLPDGLPVRVRAVERAFALDGGPEAPLGFARLPLRGRELAEYELDGPPVLSFERSLDLFGDGSAVLVELAGHTPGSVGLLLALDGGRRVLLAGDAVWHRAQIAHVRQLAPMPGALVNADPPEAFTTLHRLAALPPEIQVVPAHDPDAAARFAAVPRPAGKAG